MRWQLQVPGLLLGVAALAGCTRYTVRVNYDHSMSFRGLHTYNWRPGAQGSIGDPRVSDRLVDSTVRSAVDRELAAKGYTKVTSAVLDFEVSYQAFVADKASSVTVGEQYSPGGVWSTASWYTDTYHYEQGMLVLGIIDPKSAKLVWRGTVAAVFDPTASAEKREKRINEAVRELLKKFPPPQ
jgi:hypothetical protein